MGIILKRVKKNGFLGKTIAFVLLFCTLQGSAKIVKGKIIDSETNEAVIGATIMDEKTRKGTITDVEGNFNLEVNTFPTSLRINFIGYKQVNLKVGEKDTYLNISMEEDVNNLNEVVIIGYGTQQITQLTGSVVSLPSELFENTRNTTLDAMLGGTISGLNVAQSSGQPGASSSVRIRGGNSVNASNEPLYVIDGFIFYKDASSSKTGLGNMESSINPLASINPSDIESIEVLKDISATAIYGSRGANGVVVVTTRKGERNKNNVNYRYTIGWSNIADKLDLMNAEQWARLQKKYFNNKGGYTDAEIAELGKGTDWQDHVFRTALTQQHEISVSGGDEDTRYYISGGYVNQEGIVLNSDFERYNLRVNLERQLFKGAAFGVTATLGKSVQNGLTTTETVKYNSSPYSAGITNSLTYALFMPPVVPVYNEDGSYNYKNPYEYAYFALGGVTANPVSDLQNSVAENVNGYLLGNVYARYTYKDLTAKISIGTNREYVTQNFFAPSYTAIGLAESGIGGIGNKRNEIWQSEFTLAYTSQLNADNFLDLLVGYTHQKSNTDYVTSIATHFTNEDLKHNNLSDGSKVYAPVSGSSEASLNSFIGRINYTLLERYNLTATLRADNSSRFAKNYRWGYFPSLGLSWNINKEAFLKRFPSCSNLKLRLSAGTVGNQEIGDYEYAQSYAAGSYNGSASYQKNNQGNDKLKWETTTQYNIGVDAGFFNDRLNFIADVYYKRTDDLLLNIPVASSEGVDSQLKNIGSVTNKGVEFSVDGILLHNSKLQWSVNANIAHNLNKIEDMGGTKRILQGDNGEQVLMVGESLGSFYGLRFDGIVQKDEDVSKLPTTNGAIPTAGDIKYKDISNDGKIDQADRTVLGNIQPDFTYGFSTSFTIGNFDLFVLFQGSYGNDVYNALRRNLEHSTDCYNVLASVEKSWTYEHSSNSLPYVTESRPYSYIDSRYVEDASYLRLKNMTIGYRMNLDKISAKLRLFASADNLFILTGYKGYDPEIATGIDSGTYPMARTFSLGAELSF